MHVDQAIFTSLRNHRGSGYQVAGQSPGITQEEIKEIAMRSPSHEALVEQHDSARSVNCLVLPSGRSCLSLTVHSGPEPSGRGGWRVYTHSLLVAPQVMEQFAFHPLRLLACVQAVDPLHPLDQVPEILPSLQLVGTSRWFSSHAARQILKVISPESLTSIIHFLLEGEHVVVFAKNRQESLATAILDLLPAAHRKDVSFSTGLRYSARRPHRLLIFPRSPCAADRTGDLKRHCRFDLQRPPGRVQLPEDSWGAQLLPLLKDEQFADIALKLGQTYEPEALDAL